MDKETLKKKGLAYLVCPECMDDPEVFCPRDPDLQCLHCGKKLCAYHMFKHLKEVHKVSVEWKGIQPARTGEGG